MLYIAELLSQRPDNHNFFSSEFSDVFSHPLVEHRVIANYSLLVSVKGSNTSLKPYLIASHLDVVPATNESWEVPPFEGHIQDGYFWGRGTLDVKNGVMVCAFTIIRHSFIISKQDE